MLVLKSVRPLYVVMLLVIALLSATGVRYDRSAVAQSAVTRKDESTPATPFHDDLEAVDPGRWHKADWGNPLPPFWNYWRPDHIEFADSKMRIRLDDDPCPDDCDGRPYASGEYRSNAFYGYGRFEARLKASNIPGTVTAFFVYTGPSDDNPHDEIDIEILGQDPTEMHINYFADDVGGHELTIPLEFDASQDFHTYAFEWRKGSITWYVDGESVHIEDGGSLPATPGRIMMSLWACTGVDAWCGPFDYPGTPIYAVYDWVEYSLLPTYLPLILKSWSPPPPTPTPSPTNTSSPVPTSTPTRTPTSTPTPMATRTATASPTPTGVLEDFEVVSDWENVNGDLDEWRQSTDRVDGDYALCMGGDEDPGSITWVGEARLDHWDGRPTDWRPFSAVTLWAKRTSTFEPQIVLVIRDSDGGKAYLHRASGDECLGWPGGGWRTPITSDTWMLLTYPLRQENPDDCNNDTTTIDWSQVAGLSIEVYTNVDRQDPVNLCIDAMRLE